MGVGELNMKKEHIEMQLNNLGKKFQKKTKDPKTSISREATLHNQSMKIPAR